MQQSGGKMALTNKFLHPYNMGVDTKIDLCVLDEEI